MARCKVKAAERARRWYLANKSKARANSRNYMRRKMADPVEKEKHRLRQAKWREEHRDEFNAIQRRSAQKKRDGKKRTRRLKAKPISGRQLERIRRQAVIDAARKAFKRISMETRFHFGFFSMAFGCRKAVDRIIQSHSTEAMRITTAVACLEHLLRYLEPVPRTRFSRAVTRCKTRHFRHLEKKTVFGNVITILGLKTANWRQPQRDLWR